MKMKVSTITLILLGMLLLPAIAVADTGTYEISKQYVTLDVRLDGNVLIEYNITMEVTSSNIPWVTVGLPTSQYTINDYGGVATTCKRDDYGSWTGVKMTLDKTYYAGDSFDFSFSALQKAFIYKYGNNQSSIQFTPCWWDHSITKDLKVTFILPNEIKNVTTTSEGATFTQSRIQWQWSNVPSGQKYTIGFIMDSAPFTSLTSSTGSSSDSAVWLFIFILTITIIGVIAIILFTQSSSSNARSHYTPPSISASGYEKKTRHISMTCPNDSSKLNKRTINNTTIDFCDTCGGCFFDKGEIESLMKKDVTESQCNTNNIKMFTGRKCEVLPKCPRCDGKVEKKEKTIDAKTYRIFVCSDCGGIWLEHETYSALKSVRHNQIEKAKAKLDKSPTTKKSKSDYYDNDWWLFYPYIVFCPRTYRYSPPPSTSHSSSYTSSCACVSCACVASCACACACAGGGAAGCSPKNKISQISFKGKKVR